MAHLGGTLGQPREDEDNLEVGSENKLGEVFENAQVITNTDVAEVLQSYEHTMKEQDHTFEPNQVFKLTKEYVDRFKSFKMSASIEEFQRNLIEVHGLTEFEKGLLINLAPEEVEEAKILIPSLDDEDRFPEDVINRILSELVTYKNFQ